MDNTFPSRDLTYEWGRMAPEQLAREADGIDTKILGIFATATIIIAVMTALATDVRLDYTFIPFGLAFICFALVFVRAFWSLRVHLMFVADSPRVLREDYWPLQPEKAKQQYWEYVEKTFDDNLKVIIAKGQALRFIVPLTALEVFTLIIWLLLIALL